MSSSDDAHFTLSAGPHATGELRVVSFHGKEQLSRPYRFDIDATAGLDPAGLVDDVFDQPAVLSIALPGTSPRLVHGIVAAIQTGAAQLHGQTSFRLRLVPRLARLALRRNSRIFQGKTPVEIASAILDQAAVAYRWELARSYPVRDYCVQYEESDVRFVSRILAEVGILYAFEHPAEAAKPGAPAVSEVVVFRDQASYPPIEGDPHLVYRYAAGAGGLTHAENHVTAFRLKRAAAPTAVALKDYDFKRPMVALEAAARPAPKAGSAPAASAAAWTAEVYEHDSEYEESDVDKGFAPTFLEQHRRKSTEARGASFSRGLLAGCRFTLADHVSASFDGDYVLTRVTHRGRSAEVAPAGEPVYENDFACAPASFVVRPPRPSRRPMQVMETATVVGPAGQEIHTDQHGRIKVQFPWDREGKNDDRSSCWIRVAQAMAGGSWGFQFIPRIGTEVLVSFIGGNLDRPVVVSSLNNATHPPTHSLPQDKTRSGIRTQSTPGGKGYNEIMFQDAAGAELLSLRGQRNIEEVALNDHRVSAGQNQQMTIAQNRKIEVGGDDALRVKGSYVATIAGGASMAVGGSSSSAFAGSRSAAIAGDDTTNVAGGHTVQVGDYSHTLIGHGNEKGGHGFVLVNGDYRVNALEELLLSGGKSVKIACGKSTIELLPDQIKITSPKLVLAVTESLSCESKGNEVKLGDHIEIKGDVIKLFSKEASIVMDEDAKIDGKLVKLNCGTDKPEQSKDASKEPERGKVVFKLSPTFTSKPGEVLTAMVAMPSGEVKEFPVDANNEVHLEGVKGEPYALVDVRSGGKSVSKKPA